MAVVNASHHLGTAPRWLKALGARELPRTIRVGGIVYRRVRLFKHDFFAATGLYESDTSRVVLKVGRTAPLGPLPLSWIGRYLARREARILRFADGIVGVPRFMGTLNDAGFLHEYVEGRPLQKCDQVGEHFFPCLSEMLYKLHDRGGAYVDLEKPENIILGDDGRPHLIDFQVSWFLPPGRGGDLWPARALLGILQQSDRYHLHKHWKRVHRAQFEALGLAGSQAPPIWIKLHRLVFRPLTLLRRQVLVWLKARGSVRSRSPG